MRIRTEADVERLDQKIKQDLGIDVRKYRNEEVVTNMIALLVFPEYVITWMILPILVSLALFVVGFFMLKLVHIEYALYAVIGFVLFLVCGLLLGLLILTNRMKTDMWGIANYSLDVMKSAVSDLNQVSGQINKENRKDVLGLLFQGITHIVTIPMLATGISEKLPILGTLINPFMKRVITLIADRVKFDEAKLDAEMAQKYEASNTLELYTNSISTVSMGLKKLVGVTFGIARWPLKLAFGLLFLLLVLFVYLIN